MMSSPNTGEQQWANVVSTLSMPATVTTDFAESFLPILMGRTSSSGIFKNAASWRLLMSLRPIASSKASVSVLFEMARHIDHIEHFYAEPLASLSRIALPLAIFSVCC